MKQPLLKLPKTSLNYSTVNTNTIMLKTTEQLHGGMRLSHSPTPTLGLRSYPHGQIDSRGTAGDDSRMSINPIPPPPTSSPQCLLVTVYHQMCTWFPWCHGHCHRCCLATTAARGKGQTQDQDLLTILERLGDWSEPYPTYLKHLLLGLQPKPSCSNSVENWLVDYSKQ